MDGLVHTQAGVSRKEIVSYTLGVTELGVSVYSALLTIVIFLDNVFWRVLVLSKYWSFAHLKGGGSEE